MLVTMIRMIVGDGVMSVRWIIVRVEIMDHILVVLILNQEAVCQIRGYILMALL
jgi:hypothetical protein